jgi:hypothetical protein
LPIGLRAGLHTPIMPAVRGSLLIPLGLLGLLGACHSPPEPAKPVAKIASPMGSPSASTTSSGHQMSSARVGQLAAFVSAVRGHPFKRPVPPVRFVPRAELPTIPGANGALTQVRTQGRYFDDRHEIIIAEDLETLPDLEPIVVHELVHALMMDHGVKPFVFGPDAEKVFVFARAALIEGDANLVEAAFRADQNGRHPRRTMANMTRVHAPWLPLACRSDADAQTCGISNAINEEGVTFASALYRVGGPPLLDAAHKAPPESALEILYPDHYLAGVRERSLADDLGPALASAGVAKKALEHAGAYRMGLIFGPDAPLEILRGALHDLRGDAFAGLERGGQVALIEWADNASATRFAKFFAGKPTTSTKMVGERRLLVGVNVPKEIVESVAKNLAPKTNVPGPKPPLGHAMAAGPATWEEELATSLRADGPKGFTKIGIDAGKTLRAETPGVSSTWLFPKGEKVFVLPATAPVLSRKLFVQTVEKAWADPVAALNDPELPEERHIPIGTVRFSVAAFAMPSLLAVAVARIPVCGDAAATLLALQFGAEASVKESLAKNLESIKLSDDKSATLCKRIKAEASELTPRSLP